MGLHADASELLDHDCDKQESLVEQSVVRSGRVTGLRINCWAMILTNLVPSDAPNSKRNAIFFRVGQIICLEPMLSGTNFYLTNATGSRILQMKKYSIAEAAELVGVDRATVYRWIQQRLVPTPRVEVIAGVQITYWTGSELTKVRQYRAQHYWGQGKKRSRRSELKTSKR